MIYLKESNRQLDTVVFDLGNVLLDYSPYRFLHQAGIDSERHADIGAALFENPEVWSELDRGTLDSHGVARKAIEVNPALENEIISYMQQWHEFFEMIPDNVEAFYKIKRSGCGVYVLSNFSSEAFEKIRWKFPFLDEMDGMIISAEHQVIKPEPEIFQLLIDRYRIEPQNAVFIDDLIANTDVARTFGFNVITLPPRADIEPYFIFPDIDSKENSSAGSAA